MGKPSSLNGLIRWGLWALVLLLSGPFVLPHKAEAQAFQSLRQAMFGRGAQDGRTHEMPQTARFSTSEGDSFIFDNSQPNPVLRFDGDDEVWALTPTQGPKGDVVFKNDLGEPVLRASRWGGMTLFTEDHPEGDPAAISGKAKAIETGRISPEMLFQYLAHASMRATAAVGRLMPFSADEDTPDHNTDYLFADAANNTADAIVKLSKQNKGQKILEPVREVRLVEGRPPSVSLNNGVLELKLDVSRGWSGRPSSRRVMMVIRQASRERW